MIHPYPPVLTMALSILYKIFGFKLVVLKLATWAIILANDILIFLIVKKLTKSFKLSAFSLLFYILTQPFLEGNQLWFDLAIVPSILLGTFFFLNKKYLWAGIAFAVAALTKQTAILYLVFSALYIVLKERKIQKLVVFVVGPLVLFLVLGLRLFTEGAIGGFFNWTLIYPFTYWSKFPGYVQMVLTTRQSVILLLLIIPMIPILVNRKFILHTSYFILSLILLYPRFSFFHFQLGLAFIAILFSLLAKELKLKSLLLITYYLLLVLLIALPVFKTNWQKEARFWGKEDIKLAEMIQKETSPGNKIFLLGPHSGLYVLTNRFPPKIWSDNFGWYFEVPGVHQQIIAGWEKEPPEYIVMSDPSPGNWYDLGTYRPKQVTDWISKNYFLKKNIDGGITLWVRKD
jgi:4-amino-4-deoxy-L-arabinose transferase-like glycosyltransferase